MTIKHQIELECPDCHVMQATSVWSSINVQVNPELKEELLKGRVNVLYCRKCSRRAIMATPLLYHDMEEEFWVQYCPFDSTMSKNLLENFGPDGEMRIEMLGPRAGYLTRPPHLVFDMAELVRYVLFRDRLFEQLHAI